MAIFINLGKLFPNVPTNLPDDEDEEDLLQIEIPLSSEAECLCEIATLICKGCRCGAMQKELDDQSN